MIFAVIGVGVVTCGIRTERSAVQVQLVGKTEFIQPDVPWKPDTDGGQALAEMAGRACYQSWSKPNPATATNAGYINHILEVGHLSVLEHGSVSFYITGISRSLTHELVRHRHFSYSQLSQRYVAGASFVMPPAIADTVGDENVGENEPIYRIFEDAMTDAERHYNRLLAALDEEFSTLPAGTGKKKQARQAARSVLPNATETKIVVTGNYRAFRHFIALRATEHADVEIRALAIECLRQLWEIAPSVFRDFNVVALEDGTEVAYSKYTAID